MEEFDFYIALSHFSEVKPHEVEQIIENETNKSHNSTNESNEQ